MNDLDRAFASPEGKRQYVRDLFATIADRYDFITVVLSYGQDRRWKRRLVGEAAIRYGHRVVDLACGTGDIALESCARGASVVGLDITPRMIELAAAKARRARNEGLWPVPRFLVGDMMALPFSTHSIDVVTTGYGLRNVPTLETALAEISRVLRPGGRLLSLDFNRPENALIRSMYLGYLSVVGSALGRLLHRSADTYRYIPESIRRYPGAAGLTELLKAHGFARVTVRPLLGGLMTLHVAQQATGEER
ncbi:MAG TPA: ubiquinone/menaquinone biosynthesis methyltransferase [Vicinamibacterales bacterium]|nr:ubiquinone/menaquinone biosynthesis methyltransferase [Vicinamibacterales bacterium]